ncbi:unnamed protein product [Caenorhabditis bovis]|uniref:Uncharacterized protein n=1 Tax=Caenorhabditis bovis TaxID=2654633 RepID=A0A8S1F9R6_9PELO|nr:unnamed protein product [Caenorhabditis bovis]
MFLAPAKKECSRDLLEDLYECGGIGDDDIIGIDWLNNGSWTTYKLSTLIELYGPEYPFRRRKVSVGNESDSSFEFSSDEELTSRRKSVVIDETKNSVFEIPEERNETLLAEKNDPRLPLIDSCSPELAVPENMRKRLIDELEFFWNSVDATTWKKHGVSIYKINEKATCKPCGLRPNCFSDAVSLGTHIFARKHKNYIIKYGFSISDYAIWKEALLHCIGKKAKNKNICIEKTSKKENGSKYPLFNSFGSTNKLPKAEFIEEYDKLCEQINDIPAKIIVKMRVQKLDLTCDFCKCQIQSFSSLASHVFSKGHSKKIKEKCEGTKEDLEYWKTFIKEAQAATDIAFGNAKEEIPLFNFFGNGEKDPEIEKEYDTLAKRFSNIPIECVAIVNTSKLSEMICESCLKATGISKKCQNYQSIASHVFSKTHGEILKKDYKVAISDLEYWRKFIEKAENIMNNERSKYSQMGKTKSTFENMCITKTKKKKTKKKENKKGNDPKYPLFNSFGSTNKLPKAEFIEEYDKLCEQINGIPAKIIVKMRVQKLDLTCDFCKFRIQSFSSLASHIFSKGHSKKIKEKCEGTKKDLEYWKTFIKKAEAATDIAFENAKEEIPLFNFLGNGKKDLEFEKEYDALAKRFSNIPLTYVAKINTEKFEYMLCEICLKRKGKFVYCMNLQSIASHVFAKIHGEILKKDYKVAISDLEYWRKFIEKAEQIENDGTSCSLLRFLRQFATIRHIRRCLQSHQEPTSYDKPQIISEYRKMRFGLLEEIRREGLVLLNMVKCFAKRHESVRLEFIETFCYVCDTVVLNAIEHICSHDHIRHLSAIGATISDFDFWELVIRQKCHHSTTRRIYGFCFGVYDKSLPVLDLPLFAEYPDHKTIIAGPTQREIDYIRECFTMLSNGNFAFADEVRQAGYSLCKEAIDYWLDVCEMTDLTERPIRYPNESEVVVSNRWIIAPMFDLKMSHDRQISIGKSIQKLFENLDEGKFLELYQSKRLGPNEACCEQLLLK